MEKKNTGYSILDTRYSILDTRSAERRESKIESRVRSAPARGPGGLLLLCALSALALGGCSGMFGYSDKSLFPQDIASVRLEMFDNTTFRRGVEYELTDALAKRIEADTPYKIITSKNRADTVMTGQITNISEAGLSIEYELGGVLEREVLIQAVVNWKNLKTGELLINNQSVTATASYTSRQNQDFKYASTLAANKLAQKIVELMETKW